jgi:hypothetical protein
LSEVTQHRRSEHAYLFRFWLSARADNPEKSRGEIVCFFSCCKQARPLPTLKEKHHRDSQSRFGTLLLPRVTILTSLTALVGRSRRSLVAPHTNSSFDITLVVSTLSLLLSAPDCIFRSVLCRAPSTEERSSRLPRCRILFITSDVNPGLWVMSPQGIGISTTYKTRVALEKPCKKR